jgi:hypothetical protein
VGVVLTMGSTWVTFAASGVYVDILFAILSVIRCLLRGLGGSEKIDALRRLWRSINGLEKGCEFVCSSNEAVIHQSNDVSLWLCRSVH